MKRSMLLICTMMAMIFWLATVLLASDADMIRAEKKRVIGQILIAFDDSINDKSVYLIDSQNDEKIWMDSLKWLEPKFKNFATKAFENGWKVSVIGRVEYWTDGIVFIMREKFSYQKAK